jgi:hypothetical protein
MNEGRSEHLTATWGIQAVVRLSAIAVAGAALAALAACAEIDDTSATAAAATTPTAEEQACLRDVTGVTGNPDVVLLESSFSQAGTEVIVGVGPDRARWRCIGYSDGTTADIESLTDEGFL